MYTKTITKPKSFAGEYKIYSVSDPDCPPICSDVENIQQGDWIKDDKGIVAQIFKVVRLPRKNQDGLSYGVNLIISTCFGRDQIGAGGKRGFKLFPLSLERKRRDYYSIAKDADRMRLTKSDAHFLFLATTSGRILEAYQLAYPGKSGMGSNYPQIATRKYRALVFSKEGKEYMNGMLREKMQELGLTDESFYLGKMVESIDGPIETAVQLKILQMLGVASGNEEVVKLVDPEGSAMLEGKSFPVSQLPRAEEASFTELPEHDEGLKV